MIHILTELSWNYIMPYKIDYDSHFNGTILKLYYFNN